MADYTSTQNGNWSADATWGGGGHPSANDDTATMGHEVTYDMGDSAIAWGNVTINASGILIFPIASDSTILFNATGILTINSGGELRAGTNGAPIDAANHCYFHWPQGAAERDTLVLNDGGTINIYGDGDFYGPTRYATLNDDWTAGQTLYVSGDLSTTWASGQKFWIHENILYDNYQDDGHIYTIDTVGAYDSTNDRTPITITEAAPAITFNALYQSHANQLIMLSRNVQLCDPGATLVVYSYNAYTNRIRFDNNQAAGNNLINIHHALFYGWRNAILGGWNAIFENVAFASNDYASYLGSNFILSGDFVSQQYGISSGTNHTITGDFVSHFRAIHSGNNHIIIGDFISNNQGLTYSKEGHVVMGDFISNNNGLYESNDSTVTGDFLGNNNGINYSFNCVINGDFVGNTKDIYNAFKLLVHGDFSSINITYISNQYNSCIIYEDCDINSINRELRIYENAGTLLPLTSADGDWQAPDSENDWILQLTPNSYCATSSNMQVILSPVRDMALYCRAGTYTLTIKLYPSDWTTPLDQDDVYIKASYFASSDNARTTIRTSGQSYANAGWRSCSVTFTTGREGIVYFNFYCSTYEAAKYVLIDPQWIITPSIGTVDVYSVHGVPFKFSHSLPAGGTTLESKIYSTLTGAAAVTALTSARIYPLHRPQNEEHPSLVFSRVGGNREYTLNEGYVDLENPRVSIEVYATSVDGGIALGDAVITAMESSTRFSAITAMSPVDIYDETMEEYKRVLDFSLWNHD